MLAVVVCVLGYFVPSATRFYSIRRGISASSFAVPLGVLALILCGVVGCGGSQSGTQTPPTQTPSQPSVVGISVSVGGQSTLPVGETAQLAATATLNNGSTEKVSGTTTWSSSNSTVATVSSSGVVTAVAVGPASISASVSGVSGSAAMTIVAPVIQSIAVSPAAPAVIIGTTQQFAANGKYSDGSTVDISANAQWSFSNDAIAIISPTGLVRGQSAGSGTVSASLSGISGTAVLTVNPKALTAISVMPSGLSLYLGSTQQFAAVGSYNDGSAADITSSVTWVSSEGNSASVSTGGLVSALAAGPTTISASTGGISGTSSLTVSASNSGFTLIDDMTDSRLVLFRDTDGSVAQYNGTRTDTGALNAITSTNISHPDGTTQTVSYNDQALPIDFQMSDGSEFAIAWPSDASSSPMVTAFSSDHKLVFSAPFSLTASSSSGSSVVRANAKSFATVPLKTQSTPAINSAAVIVNVTSYDGLPENDASVEVSESGTFLGGSITADLTGAGTYQANLPTGSAIQAVSDLIESAAKPLQSTCNSLTVAGGTSAVEGAPYTGLDTVVCAALTATVDIESWGSALPTSAGVFKACTALGVALKILDKACYITTANTVSQYLSAEKTAVINFFNKIQRDVTATVVLNQDLESATNKNQPAIGPFDPFTFSQVGVVHVERVTVVPPTLTLALGSSAPLTAEAFDSNSYALKSSTFQWSWMSDNNSVASVPDTGIPVPSGSPVPSTGPATVTAEAPGSANITATETTTGTSGTSMVTATGPEVTGLWLGTYTWNPPNGETVNFGIFVGGQQGRSFTAGIGFGYPAGVEPYCAEGQGGGLNPAEFYICGLAGQITGNQFTITYPAGATSATLAYQITASISGNTMTGTICNYNNPNYEPVLCGNMTLTYDPNWPEALVVPGAINSSTR
jgi:uncharacterized protein YjdB